jgi:hypothetical protein
MRLDPVLYMSDTAVKRKVVRFGPQDHKGAKTAQTGFLWCVLGVTM